MTKILYHYEYSQQHLVPLFLLEIQPPEKLYVLHTVTNMINCIECVNVVYLKSYKYTKNTFLADNILIK